MDNNKVYLFNCDDYIDEDEWVKQAQEPEYFLYDEHDPESDIDYDKVRADMDFCEQDSLDMIVAEIDEATKWHYLVGVGTAGRWDGTPSVSLYEADIQLIMDCIRGRDFGNWRIYIDKDDPRRDLTIDFIHHDGTHSIKIRSLTDEGMEFVNSEIDEWDIGTGAINHKLFDSDVLTCNINPWGV